MTKEGEAEGRREEGRKEGKEGVSTHLLAHKGHLKRLAQLVVRRLGMAFGALLLAVLLIIPASVVVIMPRDATRRAQTRSTRPLLAAAKGSEPEATCPLTSNHF